MLKGDGSEGYAGPLFNLHTKAHLIFLKEAFQSEGTYNHLHPSLRVQRDPNRHSALSFKDKLQVSGYR